MSAYIRKTTELPKALAPRLPALTIELTERCDNDCVHCCINLPEDDQTAMRKEMSTGQIERLLEEAADLGCLEVRFTGGEPLLRPDFAQLYLRARHLGMKVSIYTNGRRIDDDLADLLAETPPLLPVEISVYGMREETYEAVTRCPGSFAEFRRGLDALLARGVPVKVKAVALPQLLDELDDFEVWADDAVKMSERAPSSTYLDLRHRRDDEAKNRLIETLRLGPEAVWGLCMRHESDYRTSMEAVRQRGMGNAGDSLFSCGAGRDISVDAYGKAQPCLRLRSPQLVVDTVHRSLNEALETLARLREMKAQAPEYLERCARCSIRDLCNQCPATAWMETGALDGVPGYCCEVAHAEARGLGWLEEGVFAWQHDRLR